MKNKFPGHLRPTEAEFETLWKEAVFVVDANSILNLYRYSTETRDELLQILTDLKGRLWMPHQVGLEFLRGRLTVISQQHQSYTEMKGRLESIIADLEATRKHPFIKQESLEKLAAVTGEIAAELEDEAKNYSRLYNNDPTLTRVCELFDGKVGDAYTRERLTEIYKQGEERYKTKIPPGYKDAKKDSDRDDSPQLVERKYGDLVVWFQIIDQAKQTSKPVILVQDDRKEDWWSIHSGRTIGPRSELVAEMLAKAGFAFHMYEPGQFMERASQHLGRKVKETAIDEAKAVAEAKSLPPPPTGVTLTLADKDAKTLARDLMHDLHRSQDLWHAERRGESPSPDVARVCLQQIGQTLKNLRSLLILNDEEQQEYHNLAYGIIMAGQQPDVEALWHFGERALLDVANFLVRNSELLNRVKPGVAKMPSVRF